MMQKLYKKYFCSVYVSVNQLSNYTSNIFFIKLLLVYDVHFNLFSVLWEADWICIKIEKHLHLIKFFVPIYDVLL